MAAATNLSNLSGSPRTHGPRLSLVPLSTEHEAKVARIAQQLRESRANRPLSLRKAGASHHVPKRFDPRRNDARINLSDLNQILQIDPEARTCTTEPGVTFERLVQETLKHGLVPQCVPELETITVGGAVSGCSIESASFRFGGFHDSCLAYEVLSAKGELIHARPGGENELLFQMMHGSFGTLGVLTKLTFRLIPAKRFVHVVYETYQTLAEYQNAIRRHYEARATTDSEEPSLDGGGGFDFMDGIIHSPTHYVLSLGRFVDKAPYTHRYDWMRIYYRSTAARKEDFLETPHYFFRYDRGVTNVHPKSLLGRFFLGKFLRSDRLLRLAETFHRVLPHSRPDLTVNLFLPFSRVPEFLSWYEREIGAYPLWCVPYRRVRNYEWASDRFWAGVKDDLFLDLAVYGVSQREGRDDYKGIEDELQRVNGIKTLISHNRYDRETFWSIWNKPNYDRVKARMDPDGKLRDLYSKTCGH